MGEEEREGIPGGFPSRRRRTLQCPVCSGSLIFTEYTKLWQFTKHTKCWQCLKCYNLWNPGSDGQPSIDQDELKLLKAKYEHKHKALDAAISLVMNATIMLLGLVLLISWVLYFSDSFLGIQIGGNIGSIIEGCPTGYHASRFDSLGLIFLYTCVPTEEHCKSIAGEYRDGDCYVRSFGSTQRNFHLLNWKWMTALLLSYLVSIDKKQRPEKYKEEPELSPCPFCKTPLEYNEDGSFKVNECPNCLASFWE